MTSIPIHTIKLHNPQDNYSAKYRAKLRQISRAATVGDFLCASKESYSPVSIMFCAKPHRGDGRNNATSLERVVGFFARLEVSTPLQIALATGKLLFLLVQEK